MKEFNFVKYDSSSASFSMDRMGLHLRYIIWVRRFNPFFGRSVDVYHKSRLMINIGHHIYMKSYSVTVQDTNEDTLPRTV